MTDNWLGDGTMAAALVAVALVAVSCGGLETAHGYVQSSDGSLSFRHPSSWQDVDVAPTSAEWIVGIDASSSPSENNLGSFVLDDPFVVAQVLPLDATSHDTATADSLRRLALTDRRDPLAGGDPTIRVIFHDVFVDDQGFEGHHMRFEVDLQEGTAVEEQFAVLDPDRTRIHRVRVACTPECFEANTEDIEALFDSVRLRP